MHASALQAVFAFSMKQFRSRSVTPDSSTKTLCGGSPATYFEGQSCCLQGTQSHNMVLLVAFWTGVLGVCVFSFHQSQGVHSCRTQCWMRRGCHLPLSCHDGGCTQSILGNGLISLFRTTCHDAPRISANDVFGLSGLFFMIRLMFYLED
ncbi:hypothetical protein XU18_2757 [Perkinsela sp. CCAP 1560/4]|nr:hypothetical protein XU18_2757 [Perkinsela sp. CCAP 1560/4]|eukprot:KNH06252.1 hypothetical protein XU18_2757 [Perkinsela sp. CCAP 1560/4]